MAITYKKAGVDIKAGDALVDWLSKKPSRSRKKSSKTKDLVSGIGGFAALYRANFSKMKDPCLVTCTDGVGTKVLLASEFKDWSGVGQDLVAMCVNDLICTGGQPLIFLDYYACGRLNLRQAKEFLASVRGACEASDCLLIGGETAEMPGVYAKDHFDCAGFAVGVVDRPKVLGPHRVKKGDRLLAFASSGFHSNGYSLLRKVFAKDLQKWSKKLLIPTQLYVQLYQQLQAKKIDIHALAHITGGGLDNIGRVLPEHLQASLQAWELPSEFMEVKKRAGMSWNELAVTLNCGIGLVAALPAKDVAKAKAVSKKLGIKCFEVGQVEKRVNSKKTWSLDFSEWQEAYANQV